MKRQRMMNWRKFGLIGLIVALLLTMTGTVFADNGKHDDKPFVPPIGRGFNVEVSNLSAGDVDVMKEQYGANLVRIAINPYNSAKNWNNMTSASAWKANLDLAEVEMREVVKKGMYAVLDMHNTPSPDRPITAGFWSNPNNLQVWIDAWKEVILRFAPYRDHIWGYDIINEPTINFSTSPPQYFEWAPQVVAAIRSLDKDTPVIVEATATNYRPYIDETTVPIINDSKLIYSFHFYDPYEYTSQGISAYSANPAITSYSGAVSYPGTLPNNRTLNKAYLQQLLEPVAEFQRTHNNVPIFIGEFGTSRWSPGRAQYIQDSIELFEQYGWSWTYHAWEADIYGPRYVSKLTGSRATALAVDPTDVELVLKANFAGNKFIDRHNEHDRNPLQSISLAFNGDFQIDSNTDGIADFWAKAPSTTASIVETDEGKSQQIVAVQAGLGMSGSLIKVKDNHRYRISAQTRVDQGNVDFYFRNITDAFTYAGSTIVSHLSNTNGVYAQGDFQFIPKKGADFLLMRWDTYGAAKFAVRDVLLYDLGPVQSAESKEMDVKVEGTLAADGKSYVGSTKIRFKDGGGLGGEYHIVSPANEWTFSAIGLGQNWKWIAIPSDGLVLSQPGSYVIGYRAFDHKGELMPAKATLITLLNP